MICPLTAEQDLELLLDYSAGKLNQADSLRIEQHRSVCAECAAFLSGQTEIWQTLDLWEPEPISIDFNRRLWQRIDAEAPRTWREQLAEFFRAGSWKTAWPLATAVVLVIAGFTMDHTVAPHTPGARIAGDISARVSEIDADQVEKTLDDLQLLSQLDAAPPLPAATQPM